MEERRKFIRLSASLPVAYTVMPADDSMLTMTKNLSEGGVCFMTKSRLIPGQTVRVDVALPSRTEPVRFTARVMWSGELLSTEEAPLPHPYEAGVQFLEIPEGDRTAILNYVAARRLT